MDRRQWPENFNAIVSSTNYSIDSLPWGTIGYKYLEPSSNYYGKEVTVTKQTVDGQYALISYGGKEVGWIDRDALKTLSTVPASYTLPIMNSGYSIDSLPWGEPGFVHVGDTAAYYGKMATVIRETANGIGCRNFGADGIKLGWVDKRTFNAAFPSFNAVIRKGSYSIDSLPWGSAGYRTLDWSSSYVGKIVTVIGKLCGRRLSLFDLQWFAAGVGRLPRLRELRCDRCSLYSCRFRHELFDRQPTLGRSGIRVPGFIRKLLRERSRGDAQNVQWGLRVHFAWRKAIGMDRQQGPAELFDCCRQL
ncbi:MAG: SH3-like domain-containing protein [Trichococcus flocculiformis]